MPPYDLINLKYVLFMLGLGVGLSFLVFLVRGARHYSFSLRKRTKKEIEETLHEFGGDVSELDSPVPLFIWLLIVGILIWSAGYIIYSGAYGL